MRKSAKRRMHTGMDPLETIRANQPFPEGEVTRILIKVHDAFARLRNGSDDHDLFDRLAAVLNVGLVRSEQIGQAGVEVFKQAQQALMEADRLFGSHKRYGFNGPGLGSMKQAIELYEEIIRASTPLQMHNAQQECIRRIRAGQYERAEATTEQLRAQSLAP